MATPTFTLTLDDTDLRRKAAFLLARMKVEPLLYAVGARHLKWIADQFRLEGRAIGSEAMGGWAKLSRNTMAARRGRVARILQDTGRLRQSFAVDTAPIRGEVFVGTSDQRAPWLHHGTRPYTIRPKRAGGVLAFTGNVAATRVSGVRIIADVKRGLIFTREVQHPGLPARPMLPTASHARDLAVAVVDAFFVRALGEAVRGGG